ncbi:MAG: hypothetical protein ACPGWR_32060, partial [Ardenticatenaceae bacterium]
MYRLNMSLPPCGRHASVATWVVISTAERADGFGGRLSNTDSYPTLTIKMTNLTYPTQRKQCKNTDSYLILSENSTLSKNPKGKRRKNIEKTLERADGFGGSLSKYRVLSNSERKLYLLNN